MLDHGKPNAPESYPPESPPSRVIPNGREEGGGKNARRAPRCDACDLILGDDQEEGATTCLACRLDRAEAALKYEREDKARAIEVVRRAGERLAAWEPVMRAAFRWYDYKDGPNTERLLDVARALRPEDRP